MGIVYKAHDSVTRETVALKVLKPEIAADQTAMERFKNETRVARKITHKNVCRIYEFAPINGFAYISMEFVEGESLRHVLSRFAGLPLRRSIRVAHQICAGLREAHGQGIVHRDLKSENIMIDRSGDAKIMDFGIARSVNTGITQGALAIGTPAYMLGRK
jgi:eukaryotic-like serine/threonine-protein kinase